jgi:hypothetical protein
MKKILLALFLLTNLLAQAQDINVSLSKPFEIQGGDDYFKIGNSFYKMEIDQSGLDFAVSSKLNKSTLAITLYKYDNAMNEIRKNELEGGKKTFGPFLSKMVRFDNMLLLFNYKYYNSDTMRLFVSQIDTETLATINTKEVFSYVQGNTRLRESLKYSSTDNLLISLSPDKSKIIVAHVNTEMISSCIINKNLDISEKTLSKTPDVRDFRGLTAFTDNGGNKYIGYRTGWSETMQRGIFIQTVSGKEVFTILDPGTPMSAATDISFCNSKDNTHINVYGTYTVIINSSGFDEGVFLTTIDTGTLKINNLHLFPYSDDFKKRMYDLDFGYKKKGVYYSTGIEFNLTEQENGAIELLGLCHKVDEGAFAYVVCGPIVSLLIHNGKMSSTVIPRLQPKSEASSDLVVQNKNNIVCIYTDYEKNLALDMKGNKIEYDGPLDKKIFEDLVLVSAVIDTNNNVISRKKIGDKPDKGYYFLSYLMQLTDNSFILPIGKHKTTMSDIYAKFLQWSNLEIQ